MSTAMTMTFEQAAERQHRYGSYYTVWLLGPDGEREYLGFTARKSGAGLLKFMSGTNTQNRMKQFPNAEALTCTKHKDRLELSNGWKIQFGGTIRQEAADQTQTKQE